VTDDRRAWGGLDVVAQRQGGLKTLEVRWIHSGPLPVVLIEWLARSPAEIEIREDRYLVAPLLEGIGVKIRGAVQLDLKIYRGTPGNLRLAADVRGRLEIWEKWALPLDVEGRPPTDVVGGWVAVQKLRRKRSFAVVDGRVIERAMSQAEEPGCTVELTEVLVGESVWWTLGFEAGGPLPRLKRELAATAAYLLNPPLPVELRLDRRDSMSYVEWLRRQPARR